MRADLRVGWAASSLAAGFDPTQPSVRLAEGLVPYLEAAAQDALIRTVSRHSSARSAFAVDRTPVEVRTGFAADRQRTGQDIDFGPLLEVEPVEVGDLLRTHGRDVHAHVLDDVAARWGTTDLGNSGPGTGATRSVTARTVPGSRAGR